MATLRKGRDTRYETRGTNLRFFRISYLVSRISEVMPIHQAVLIDCYIVQRAMGVASMLEAMKEAAQLINQK